MVLEYERKISITRIELEWACYQFLRVQNLSFTIVQSLFTKLHLAVPLQIKLQCSSKLRFFESIKYVIPAPLYISVSRLDAECEELV
jgi:hypothetical protein